MSRRREAALRNLDKNEDIKLLAEEYKISRSTIYLAREEIRKERMKQAAAEYTARCNERQMIAGIFDALAQSATGHEKPVWEKAAITVRNIQASTEHKYSNV